MRPVRIIISSIGKKILHVDSYKVSLILLHDLLADPTTLKNPGISTIL